MIKFKIKNIFSNTISAITFLSFIVNMFLYLLFFLLLFIATKGPQGENNFGFAVILLYFIFFSFPVIGFILGIAMQSRLGKKHRFICCGAIHITISSIFYIALFGGFDIISLLTHMPLYNHMAKIAVSYMLGTAIAKFAQFLGDSSMNSNE